MHYYEVAPTRIVRTGSTAFTYFSKKSVGIGQIVLIELGKKEVVGVVISKTKKPEYTTKEILSVIDSSSLPKQLIELATWMSKYYASPLANVLQTILPSGVHKKRRATEIKSNVIKRKRTNFLLSKEQSEVISAINNKEFGTTLLQGVTGSGKTQVYIELAKQSIESGKSVIILTPEISLTSQLVSEFSNSFSNILVTHSKMTEAERHTIWKTAFENKNPMIAIGPRSALFTPFNSIGLIVVDESHEPSYKQEQSPKYSALRVSSILGKLHKAKVIFGSATPSVEDRFLAEQTGESILRLNKVAIKNTPPEIKIINMTKREDFKRHRFLSDELIDSITNTLNNKKQVLIFHNRRGSASTTLCTNCGWVFECPNCHLPLSLHADKHVLKCHICNYTVKVPTSCPVCKETDIIHKGIGTKLIESELKKVFPNKRIVRFDSDSESAIETSYSDIYNGKIDIIIGTQVVAKGLDLPNLRMVGVIQADAGLTLPNYNSTERTFQLLSQVIGRVGRNKHRSTVIVQTFRPDHPSIVYGLKQDFESFYRYVLDERKQSNYPPFTYLMKVNCTYKTESAAIKNTKSLYDQLKKEYQNDIQILGPTPAFYEHIFNSYRWQLVIKSKKRELLINIAASLPQNYWQFEIDPITLL